MQRASCRRQIVEGLLDADAVASAAARQAREERGKGSLAQDELAALLRTYVCAKYRLDQEECASDRLEELAEASLAKALAIDPELARRENAAATCDGASTTDMKQALLLMALQRDFEVQLDGIALAYAETLDDLAQLVGEAMGL